MEHFNILTIEEYCNSENISDSGARKRVKQKKVKSAIIDEELHILIPSNQSATIKDLKHKITTKNATIKNLREFKKNANNEADKIIELENKIEALNIEYRNDIKEIYKDNQQELVKTIQGSIAIHNKSSLDQKRG